MKIMKRLSAAIFFLAICGNVFSAPSSVDVRVNGRVVTALIASTPAQQAKGFMFKPKISEDEAMIFVYPVEDVYSFWMKNTKFALDIIWLDSKQKAVYIKENFTPCVKEPCMVETPKAKARYVLEVKAGTVKKTSLKVGDRVYFNLP